jgi:hypothetical protein
MKTCIACGMPMESAADYPNGNTGLDYCVHCARPDGSMQSYDEKATSLAAFIVRTQGLDEDVALGVAKDMMAKLPAWQ